VFTPTGIWEAGKRTGGDELAQPAGSTWLSLASTADPEGVSGAAQVAAVRAVPVPGHVGAVVGGPAASLVDLEHGMGARLPLAIVLIVLVTFALLFLYTGSVLLPLKALALNALSLCAVLGISVWIFQDGHLSKLLGFSASPLAIAMPVLLFVIAFGLSMDYEVFVLSRIKELHDAGYADSDAVSHGLARSGRIISTAAALLSVTFFAVGTSHLSFLQLFGIGTALAILIDATLVRGVLVPALMGLAGPLNWWAPTSLRRIHERVGLSEERPDVAPHGLTVPDWAAAE
jgi:RND superfamily putative drug exporter